MITTEHHTIGGGSPCYIVAELSGNHNLQRQRAIELIRAAKQAGADAVKTQTYRPDTLTIDADTDSFRISGTKYWSGKTLYELYSEAYTPWEWMSAMQEEAHRLGLDFLSSPFDSSAVDLLEELAVQVFKVASFENVDLALLRYIGRTGKPVFLSTGLATLGELEESVAVLRDAGAGEIVLLKCTSAYPAYPEEMNLRTIPHLAETFGCMVGLSDHSMGLEAPLVAVSLGAVVVEKHLTLSRRDGGSDAGFSLEPKEFSSMVQAIRSAEAALGRVSYERSENERRSLIFRRSLFVVADVGSGERFTGVNVRCIRPGHGLHPRHLSDVIGKRAARDVKRGTPLSWDLVDGSS